MSLNKWAAETIPPPKGKVDTMHQDGNTKDIINTILYADSKVSTSMCEFASAFKKSYDGLYDLWHFVRTEIEYKADAPGNEKVKDPTVTWRDRDGDCKSFSLFIASVLKCLQIQYKYRFASYQGDDPTHVYIIATLNGREVILDATIDKFDSEVSYIKKWDKVTKIQYLHGASTPAINTGRAKPTKAERIADAPRIGTPKSYIDYSGMTEGMLTLRLLEELVTINKNYYGDRNGTYQKALNLIYNTAKDPHRISGYVGSIPEELYAFMPYIEYARERSKPAGINGAHIADFATDREKILAECKHITRELHKTIPPNCDIQPSKQCLDARAAARAYQPKKLDGTIISRSELNKLHATCQDQVFFMDVFNQNLEGQSPHLLYEFLDRSTVTGTANFKANNHRLANDSMTRFSQLDRTNLVLWQRTGITRASAAKNLVDISPEGLIDEMKLIPKNFVGEPITVLSVIAAAIAFASKMLALILEKKATFASEVRGYSGQNYGPEGGDFEGEEQSEKKGYDFNSLLLPGALALGGIVLLNSK